jgi:hypothetical protein
MIGIVAVSAQSPMPWSACSDLVGVFRYATIFKWSFPLAWLYLLFMLAAFIGGSYSTIEAWGLRGARRTTG